MSFHFWDAGGIVTQLTSCKSQQIPPLSGHMHDERVAFFVRKTICTVHLVAIALHQNTLGAQPWPASQLGTSGSGKFAQRAGNLGIILLAGDFFLGYQCGPSFNNLLSTVLRCLWIAEDYPPDTGEGNKMSPQ